MTDIKQHTRRPPQPPIPAERIVPGSRWQKNRACHQGQPPQFDVVDRVETVSTQTGDYDVVYYHNEATLRRGKMLLKDFCAGSEHKEPDHFEEAPPSGTRETEAEPDVHATLAKHGEILAEILAILKRREPKQLDLVVTK